jgi:hypothetical protein
MAPEIWVGEVPIQVGTFVDLPLFLGDFGGELEGEAFSGFPSLGEI